MPYGTGHLHSDGVPGRVGEGGAALDEIGGGRRVIVGPNVRVGAGLHAPTTVVMVRRSVSYTLFVEVSVS